MLQLQIKSCRDVDLDNRLQACYLGDFLLDGKTTHLDQRLLAKVQQVRRPRPRHCYTAACLTALSAVAVQSCAVLKHANARAFIRATYLDDNAAAQSKVRRPRRLSRLCLCL